MPQAARQHFETQLATLVEKFAKHRDDYLRADYSETEVRAEFIDRLFEALGWDVYNNAGRSPKTREVFREAGETHGRVDYVFRVDGRDVFYVEAKAPHVPLDRVDVVMQAKSYAWHSRDVFIAAVTDFEEFRLYDATAKPDRKHPHAGQIFAFRYDEYLKPKTLDDLWLLSREAVAGGSIDRLLKKSSVQARQRIPVDQAFLDDLSEWREELAKAVFKANPELSPADLNSVVQVFLDRLIFIRICEDRRIMEPRQLEEVARNWEFSGKRVLITNDLNALFHDVNDRLNGEIFKPGPVEKIDWDINAALVAEIIKKLYFPASPYLFDKIPVELLGSIYERYLGKTIRVTATRAVVEDKPEVRKAGGVYYTPKYIVDYIVAQTVGKLIAGKTPKQIASLRILDPACGSGSFLIGAYQTLLDYHKQYYVEHARARDANAVQPRLIEAEEGGELKLSLEEKAAILRNNIYGVDIDPQAVEITMMSLYVKMLEDERGVLSGRALLPRLRDNIKCGNSLIGYDIGVLSDEDKARINPFDWNSKSEGFGEIMAAGGFDAVIGNPPYGMPTGEKELSYYAEVFNESKGRFENYELFIFKSLSLCRKGGLFSFIIPSPFLTNVYTQWLRSHMIEKHSLVEITNFGMDVFDEPTVHTCVIVVSSKTRSGRSIRIRKQVSDPKELAGQYDYEIDIESLASGPKQTFDVFIDPRTRRLLDKLFQNSEPLGDVAYIRQCIKTGNDAEYVSEFSAKPPKPWVLTLRGRDIERYNVPDVRLYLKYGEWLARNWTNKEFYERGKIAIRETGSYIVATLDAENRYFLSSLYSVYWKNDADPRNLKYLLGLLNARLATYVLHAIVLALTSGAFTKARTNQLARIPIRTINFADPADKSRHDKIVVLVERMLDLHKQKQAAKSDAARERIEREINVTDEQIDALVYELYGLAEEEIKTIEESAR